MKLLTLILISVISLYAQIGDAFGSIEKSRTAIRAVQRKDGFFLVEYTYSVMTGFVWEPATNPPGQLHYRASIAVFRIVKGKRQKIGRPFPGQYTLNGCFEDDPKTLVEFALKHQNDPAPTGKITKSKCQPLLAIPDAVILFDKDGCPSAVPAPSEKK